MASLIEKIEEADAFVLASPTNFGTVTAVFKRFLERLTPYSYWPWEAYAPKYRKQGEKSKPALLISSCAAPGVMGHLFFRTLRDLKYAAKIIGAKSAGSLMLGMVASQSDQKLSRSAEARLGRLASKLAH